MFHTIQNFFTRKLVRTFFNFWFKIRKPEMVQYWLHKDAARAKVVTDEHGVQRMEIEGEKYLYPGFPRGHILMGPLATLKNKVKNRVFNEVFAELEKMVGDMKYDLLPKEKMVPAVREIYEVLEEMEHMEVVEDMKLRIKLIRTILTFFLQEDDAYRFRAQYFLSNINQKKVALDKADLYYARAKYWKPDYKKFDY